MRTPAETRRELFAQHRGYEKSYLPWVLDTPDGETPVRDQYAVERFNTDLATRSTIELAGVVAEHIRCQLRVPPSKVGNFKDNSGLGRAGVELEDWAFKDGVIKPEALIWREELQAVVVDEEFGTEVPLVVSFQPFVPEDHERRLRAMQAFPEVYTVDEKRAAAGAPPMKDPRQGKAHTIHQRIVVRPDLVPEPPGNAPGGKHLIRCAEYQASGSTRFLPWEHLIRCAEYQASGSTRFLPWEGKPERK